MSEISSSHIKKIGIVGAGQMGIGIAYVSAVVAKRNVVIMDTQQKQLDGGLKFIDGLLKKEVSKGRLSEAEIPDIKGRLQVTTTTDSFSDVDFVVEAATENPELKAKIFEGLDKAVPAGVVLASNTSSISITKIASSTNRPEKVIGMHFMNPVPVMKLVEIIPGIATSPDTLAVTRHLASDMGKTVTTSNDYPGFIANRILMPYINEAVYVLMEGVGTKEDIDTTMKLGTNVPMGPLTLADFIGLDTCLAIMRVLHSQLGDAKYRPCPLLINYVNAGWLGKKTGRGFYEYPAK
ncbi:hypothetical protein M427DRAFT_94732 [Gonapodya prolifera JEL478]|uniref:3-hydroxybutyryl-CoA dehydrogenase n=1 Tax=Gonapodya prolifera (strain JEL478) TaxID=1344416 RepID=A0A139AUB4_GONPJ|nr:hypothetical protein M427DRAFT_94732 [Gonapodya prolifera JEL478]|eukprot:KXS20308.1 hypothetical protein M427DRAFT_94732 [Gonapodya prolifera JEL478]